MAVFSQLGLAVFAQFSLVDLIALWRRSVIAWSRLQGG